MEITVVMIHEATDSSLILRRVRFEVRNILSHALKMLNIQEYQIVLLITSVTALNRRHTLTDRLA